MSSKQGRPSLHLRGLLAGLGGRGSSRAEEVVVAEQAAATPGAAWTPPPIPQPLPTPGGTPPTPVGAAPAGQTEPNQPAHPESDLEGTPQAGAATPTAPEAAAEDPGEPAVPVDEEATPVAQAVAQAAATITLTPEFAFDPAEVTISRGETVLWENAGRSPQTVTCDPARIREAGRVQLPEGAEPWDSGVVNSGGSFQHTFDVAGEYVYGSMNRAVNMSGRVTVQE